LLGAVPIGMAGGSGLTFWCDVTSILEQVSGFTHLLQSYLIHFRSGSYSHW
jgi:hypothetical protein